MADTSGISTGGWNVRQDLPYSTELQGQSDIANPDRKSYMALPSLIGAEAQHNLDNRMYAGQLATQRQYAYNQLAAKIAENNAKNAVDVMRLGNDNPGAVGFAAANPSTSASFAGMDPSSLGTFNDWSARMNTSKMAEALGKGAQGFLQGGQQMPTDYVSSVLPGAPGMTLSDNPIIAAAKIKEAGASARAANPSGGLGWTGTVLPDGTPVPTGIHGKGPMPSWVLGGSKIPGAPTTATPATPHVGGGSNMPDLPMAQQDTPANRSPPSGSVSPAMPATAITLPNNSQGAAIHSQVASRIAGADKGTMADVRAGATGGKLNIRVDPAGGGVWVIGASGNRYRVQ